MVKKLFQNNKNMLQKHLYRSKKDRIFTDVCGGIAERYQFDPNIVRIFAVVLGLLLSGGFLIYLLLWFIIPFNPAEKTIKRTKITDFLDDIEKQAKDLFRVKNKKK